MSPCRARALALALAAALVLPACGLLHRSPSEEAPAPIDLNHASLRSIERLPGITPSMARRIVEGRPYEDAHDLVGRGILTEREFARIADRVFVKDRGR
jgi:DNA uptake protein ComE-like DNA-binding protein